MPAINKTSFIALLIITLCGCGNYHKIAPNQTVSLESLWVLSGLDSPESVVVSSDSSFLYVSNVNGQATDKDGNGYISKISLTGKLLDKNWTVGLNGPKGLALAEGILYVSDIDHLVLIDTTNGKIKSRIPVDGAGFLNDVVVTEFGVLISDSAKSRIYQYRNNKISVWQEDELLAGVNGLLALKKGLLITTMSSGSVLLQDWNSKKIKQIASGMPNADGIAILKDNSYIVSSWPGKLYHISHNGNNKVLLDSESQKIYLNDFLLLNGILLIPNWQPGSLSAYQLRLQ